MSEKKTYSLTVLVDQDRVKAITPEQIKKYLTIHGWSFCCFIERPLEQPLDKKIKVAEIWIKEEIITKDPAVSCEYEVQIPLMINWVDYGRNIMYALHQIEEYQHNKKGTLEILEEIEKTSL